MLGVAEGLPLAGIVGFERLTERDDLLSICLAFGIAPQLAVLESLVNPTSAELLAVNALSQTGTLAPTSTSFAWPPACETTFPIQWSRPSPLANTSFALATLCTSLGRGS